MNSTEKNGLSRRDVLKTAGVAAAASALAGVAVPYVHAAENNTIQVALVGCGGRGTGAAATPSTSKNGPFKLVAMADVFKDRLKSQLQDPPERRQVRQEVDVPDDRKFIGFDAYKKAMDCLKPGDMVILDHAAGLPLGPLRLRHREGPQRLHGEAGRRRTARPRRRCSSSAKSRTRRTSRSASA